MKNPPIAKEIQPITYRDEIKAKASKDAIHAPSCTYQDIRSQTVL